MKFKITNVDGPQDLVGLVIDVEPVEATPEPAIPAAPTAQAPTTPAPTAPAPAAPAPAKAGGAIVFAGAGYAASGLSIPGYTLLPSITNAGGDTSKMLANGLPGRLEGVGDYQNIQPGWSEFQNAAGVAKMKANLDVIFAACSNPVLFQPYCNLWNTNFEDALRDFANGLDVPVVRVGEVFRAIRDEDRNRWESLFVSGPNLSTAGLEMVAKVHQAFYTGATDDPIINAVQLARIGHVVEGTRPEPAPVVDETPQVNGDITPTRPKPKVNDAQGTIQFVGNSFTGNSELKPNRTYELIAEMLEAGVSALTVPNIHMIAGGAGPAR